MTRDGRMQYKKKNLISGEKKKKEKTILSEKGSHPIKREKSNHPIRNKKKKTPFTLSWP